MEIITYPHVFQTDSDIVKSVYKKFPNYIIEYNEEVAKEYCILYFSSNDIYYPNNEIAFTDSIVKKNRFEWYGNRINYGYKHIFLRDIQKQWYLTGINATIDTPEKLINFLKKEIEGYKLVCVGASAGGFISMIIGQVLNAACIYTFNGQFEILSILHTSSEEKDPVIFRNRNNVDLLPYYDVLNFIVNPSSIFYFHSNLSVWDKQQNKYIGNLALNKISFNTNNHGIPFLKSNLKVVLNLSTTELLKMTGKSFNPLFFSLKVVGLLQTIKGLNTILQFALNKLYITTIQRFKVN